MCQMLVWLLSHLCLRALCLCVCLSVSVCVCVSVRMHRRSRVRADVWWEGNIM